jgi:hypothetical protein
LEDRNKKDNNCFQFNLPKSLLIINNLRQGGFPMRRRTSGADPAGSSAVDWIEVYGNR